MAKTTVSRSTKPSPRAAKGKKTRTKALKAASLKEDPELTAGEFEAFRLGAQLGAGVQQPAATPTTVAAPAPHPMDDRRIYPFDNGEPNRDAPLLLLLSTMFSAPNLPGIADPSAAFLASVMLASADDADLVRAAANDGLDYSEQIERTMHRLDYRLRLAVEIFRRVESGEVTP